MRNFADEIYFCNSEKIASMESGYHYEIRYESYRNSHRHDGQIISRCITDNIHVEKIITCYLYRLSSVTLDYNDILYIRTSKYGSVMPPTCQINDEKEIS